MSEESVETHVARVAELATTYDRVDLTKRLEAELRGLQEPFAAVVVAGEANKGKSSLINALIARPGLVPVDGDAATNVRIVLRYSEREFAQVLREGREPEEFPIDEIPQWASTTGNPHNEKGVQLVQAGLPHSLLKEGLVLVDTPGVGGLDAAHGEITLSALSAADALLFVLDGSAPLTEPELSFLRRATDRVGTVIFALAKSDLYGGWRQTLAENRALLEAYAPQWKDNPLIPVSSRAALRAHAYQVAGKEDLAQRLSGESGLDELKAVIAQQILARANVLRERKALSLSQTALAEMALADAPALAAAEGDSGLEEALRDATRRRADFTENKRVGSVAVADEFNLLGQALTREFNREINDLRATYEHDIRANRLKPDDIAESLDTDLRAILARLDRELNRRVLELIDRLMRELRIELSPAQTELSTESSLAGQMTTGPGPGGVTQISTLAPSIFPAVGLASIGATVGSFLGIAAVTGGLGIVAGLTLVPINLVHRRRVRDQQDAQALVRTGLDRARAEVPPLLNESVLRVRRDVEEELQAEVKRREQDLTQAVENRQRLLRSAAAKREQARAEVKGRLEVLEKLRVRGDELNSRLAASSRRAELEKGDESG